jgi:hypothetical protein
VKTCAKGHSYAPGKGCPECKRERERKRREDPEYRERQREYDRRRYAQRNAKP